MWSTEGDVRLIWSALALAALWPTIAAVCLCKQSSCFGSETGLIRSWIGNASGQSGAGPAGPPHSKVAPGDLTGGVFDFQQVGTDARGSQHQAYYCLGILNLAVGDHFQSLRDRQSHNLENFVVFKPLLRRG